MGSQTQNGVTATINGAGQEQTVGTNYSLTVDLRDQAHAGNYGQPTGQPGSSWTGGQLALLEFFGADGHSDHREWLAPEAADLNDTYTVHTYAGRAVLTIYQEADGYNSGDGDAIEPVSGKPYVTFWTALASAECSWRSTCSPGAGPGAITNTGHYVRNIGIRLSELGFPVDAPGSEYFGYRLQRALMGWQRATGRFPTGTLPSADPHTDWDALFDNHNGVVRVVPRLRDAVPYMGTPIAAEPLNDQLDE